MRVRENEKTVIAEREREREEKNTCVRERKGKRRKNEEKIAEKKEEGERTSVCELEKEGSDGFASFFFFDGLLLLRVIFTVQQTCTHGSVLTNRRFMPRGTILRTTKAKLSFYIYIRYLVLYLFYYYYFGLI
jgi:hypothetical protein